MRKARIGVIFFVILILCLCMGKVTYSNNDVVLKSIDIGTTSYGKGYLYGQIETSVEPTIKFKSVDGTIEKEVYVEKRQDNIYYFDRHLVEIDLSKKYVLEVTIGNITKNLNLGSDRVLGTFGDYKVVSENSSISILKNEYEGIPNVTLKNINLGNTSYGAKYIYGNIEYTESIDGVSTEAKVKPTIVFKSTDGTLEKEVYVEKKGTNTYYFDRHLTDLDMTKEYVFEVKSANKLNISDEKVNIVLGKHNLGINSNKYQIYTENDKLNFVLETYEGTPIVQFQEFNLGITNYNDGYVYGKIKYTENINGKTTQATEKPKILFKSTDGTVQKEVYVEKQGTDIYYFDRHLARLDYTKEYEFEVCSGDIRNTITKPVILSFKDKSNKYINSKYIINILENTKMNILKYTDDVEERYIVKGFNMGLNTNNCTFLYGTIEYIEYTDESKNSNSAPIMEFKSTDGTIEKEVYVEKTGTNTYYFDRFLDGIDISKKYQFIIKNAGQENTMTLDFGTIKKQYSNYKYDVKINNLNEIEMTAQTYYGALDSGLFRIAVNQNSNGNYYINGNLDSFEWVNGSKRKLLFNPKIELISTDNKIVKKCYVEYNAGYGSGYQYYFDCYIDGIDTGKEYIIKVTNMDMRNTNTVKSQNLYSSDCNIGRYLNYMVMAKNSRICFSYYSYVTQGVYGVSGLKSIGDGRGSNLRYYKIGWGPNVFFGTFAMHGFEDLWSYDGQELTTIAEDFVQRLKELGDENILNKWTIYIFPQVNPDGAKYGYSNNGPGRHTLRGLDSIDGYKGIDINRSWQTSSSYKRYYGRNYNASYACASLEASNLRDFLLSHKSTNGQTVLVDFHGWTTQLIGDEQIGIKYYGMQFYGSESNAYSKYTSSYGTQYLINWARTALASNGRVARTALIELPEYAPNGNRISSHLDVVNAGYSNKYYNATIQLLREL